jgi:hypothetical protein
MTNQQLDLKIGADPELFLWNTQERFFTSAAGWVPGTKHNPEKVACGAIQTDGLAAEINIDPAQNENDFVYNLNSVELIIENLLPLYLVKYYAPYVEFPIPYWDHAVSAIEKQIGCDPDFNAYTKEKNPPPTEEAVLAPIRTAAGHVHIGWTENVDPFDPSHFEDCCEVVKQLDILLGLNTLIWDPDNRRRNLYGKAGAFRPKHYGVEYRVPSNVWLGHELRKFCVYRYTVQAVQDLFEGNSYLNRAQKILGKSWTPENTINNYTASPVNPVIGGDFRPAHLLRMLDLPIYNLKKEYD